MTKAEQVAKAERMVLELNTVLDRLDQIGPAIKRVPALRDMRDSLEEQRRNLTEARDAAVELVDLLGKQPSRG